MLLVEPILDLAAAFGVGGPVGELRCARADSCRARRHGGGGGGGRDCGGGCGGGVGERGMEEQD